MKFKVRHSRRDGYTVYRKFSYSQRSLGLQGFLSVAFMSVGIFLSIPTPEDILVLGAIGKIFSNIFGLTTGKGILYATLAYKGAGIALIVIAIVLGGNYIKQRLKSQVDSKIRYLNHKLRV